MSEKFVQRLITEIKTASDKNFQPPIVASFNLSPLIRVKATPPYELRYAHHDSRFLNLHRIIRVFNLLYSNLFRNNLIGYTVSFRIMTSTIRKERKKEEEGRSKCH